MKKKMSWTFKTLTPTRIGFIFLAGFLIGLILITLGWAEDSNLNPKHSKKHPKIAAHRKLSHPATAPHISLTRYSQPDGLYEVRYPAAWKLHSNGNAIVMKSSDQDGNRGVFGILRRDDNLSNDDAVSKEFASTDKPSDLVKMPALVAGMPATKVIGSDKHDPNTRMVEYYVQHRNGHQYYILMMAPRSAWNHYSVAFNTMLSSLSLN